MGSSTNGGDVFSKSTTGKRFYRAKSSSFISKEFINTYLECGRKLPLGARETSNCALIRKHREAKVNTFPVASSIDANGEKVYTTSPGTVTPEYDTIRVIGSCPAYLKNK